MAILITGAAGFIGSCLVSFLNDKGREDLILVDRFNREDRSKNLEGKKFIKRIDRDALFDAVDFNELEFVFHIGARTDTTEFDRSVFDELNVQYSKELWTACSKYRIPMIYASSAATYGAGEHGFDDEMDDINLLRPLNPYGESKQQFDEWVLKQELSPPFWCGLKFFNVFGPNEYHKGRMASVVLHAFDQIKRTGKISLFMSHRKEYLDGEQKRDFIYVKDLMEILWFWYQKRTESGIYNAGTGKAETFLSLAQAIFKAMNLIEQIDFIPTPEDIRDKYQYFTEATMAKTRKQGFDHEFYSLEHAVNDYVKNYLQKGVVY